MPSTRNSSVSSRSSCDTSMKRGTMSDWMERRMPRTKLPYRIGVARDLIFANANPARMEKKMMPSVAPMV